MVPGVVPVELLVACTDTHAVLVDGLLVYPTGLDFDLAVRRRPGHPRHYEHRWGYDLRLEVRFADGRTADNDPAAGPTPPATSRRTPRCCTGAPVALMVVTCGCGACLRPDRSPSLVSGRPNRSHCRRLSLTPVWSWRRPRGQRAYGPTRPRYELL
jgi:hypothetical protein